MPADYAYHRAGSVDEACRLLNELPDASILAGGTDLLVDLDTGLRTAQHVVGIGAIPELRSIDLQDESVCLGAGCTASETEASPIVRHHLPELADMVVVFASPQIRNRATIAGNICSAVACGDFPTVLMALGASVDLRSSTGERTVPLSEFFRGNRQTIREAHEMITNIRVPAKPVTAAASYQKFRRRAANSLAVASVAAYVEFDGDVCRDARIVLGAVGPTPLVAAEACTSLRGHRLDEEAIRAAAHLARGEARPITDVRASDDYRRDLVEVLTTRALHEALKRARA